MKKIKRDTPIYNRRIILIDEEKNNPKINWSKLIGDSLTSPLLAVTKSLYDNDTYLNNSTAFGEIDYCNNNFKFPPQHPQKGVVYSCPDFESDFYIPIANFHQHALKLKENAFIEMCAHLGAKEIILMEEIVDNVKINLDAKANNIPTQNGTVTGGIKGGFEKNEFKGYNVSYKIPKPSKHNFKPYENKWIETEPDWRTLQKVRIENNVSEYSTGLNYTDEMGINLEVAGNLSKIGLNIGGDFNKIKKVERKYKILFWNNLE